MSEYRRWWVPGGTYFFTVNLADRSQRLLVERFDALCEVACAVRHARSFEMVVRCLRRLETFRDLYADAYKYVEHMLVDQIGYKITGHTYPDCSLSKSRAK